jgi:hypothetical protein
MLSPTLGALARVKFQKNMYNCTFYGICHSTAFRPCFAFPVHPSPFWIEEPHGGPIRKPSFLLHFPEWRHMASPRHGDILDLTTMSPLLNASIDKRRRQSCSMTHVSSKFLPECRRNCASTLPAELRLVFSRFDIMQGASHKYALSSPFSSCRITPLISQMSHEFLVPSHTS